MRVLLIIFISLICLGIDGQLQLLYKEANRKVGIIGAVGVSGDLSKTRVFGAGGQANCNIHLMDIVQGWATFEYLHGPKTQWNQQPFALNYEFMGGFMPFGKIESKMALFYGIESGNRNYVMRGLPLINTETGTNFMDYPEFKQASGTEDDKIAVQTSLPLQKIGLGVYSRSEDDLGNFYLFYSRLSIKESDIHINNDMSYYNANIPISYELKGYSVTKHGGGLGWVMYFEKLGYINGELGFRPTIYNAGLEEFKKPFLSSFFLSMSFGVRIF